MDDIWHQQSIAESLNRLGAHSSGLDPDDLARRRAEFGPNELTSTRRRSPLQMLAAQFANYMILVLIAAAIISGIVGDLADTIVIGAIVILNAVIGFVQEYRAERALAALKAMSAATATVRRGGRLATVPAAELVPVDKITEAIAAKDPPLGDRYNMAYKGTAVTHGRGLGVVVATGMRTEFGRIARLPSDTAAVATPLQQRLHVFGRGLVVVVLAICRRAGHLRHHFYNRPAARRVRAADVSHRTEPGRHSLGPAGSRQHRARRRRAKDAGTEGADTAPAGRGNTRFGDGHLLGQDRYAHRQRNAGGPVLL